MKKKHFFYLNSLTNMSIASNGKLDFTIGIPIYKQITNWVYSEIKNENLRERDRHLHRNVSRLLI